MKINNFNDYANYRILILNNELVDLKRELEINNVSISEINGKINEIKTVVDEGFNMFSPIAAEEEIFNKQEVRSLQTRLVVIVDSNKELNKQIKAITHEIKIINSLIKNENDGKDSFSYESIQKIVKNLEFCCSIIDNDTQRAKIELKFIIDILKEDKK